MIVFKRFETYIKMINYHIAEKNERFTSVTVSNEVEEELEGWVNENYMEIVDTVEFLDSSRVKRID